MADKSYPMRRCPKCKKLMPINGVAWSSHMKSHENKKDTKKKEPIDLRQFPYAMVGEEAVCGQPPKTWQLPNLDIEFPEVKSLSYYFITTGEAIIKIERYIDDLSSRIQKAKKLRQKMLKSRGKSKYLETAREGSILLCKQKDPRKPRDDLPHDP